jgi:hypothetical protein
VRIAGWVLLVGWLLLCVSVAWAALGFLLMGVGLISLQVAERNRNRAKLALASRAERVAAPTEIPEGPFDTAHLPAGIDVPRPDRAAPTYDTEAWRRLVESDQDLLRVTSLLQAYGQSYADELARTYLADGDPHHLPAMVDAIIRKAKRNLAKRNAALIGSAAPDIDRPSRAPDGPLRQTGYRTEPRPPRIPATASTMAATPPPVPAEPADRMEEVGPAEAPLVAAPAAEVLVEPQVAVAGQRDRTITSADDALTELIGKFASDSSFRRGN